jgi:alpha-aminoadipate carrier protein LysW
LTRIGRIKTDQARGLLGKHQDHKYRRIKMATCPECAGELDLAPDVEAGEIVVCPDCGVELEVMGVNPITLDLAPEVEEDWGE